MSKKITVTVSNDAEAALLMAALRVGWEWAAKHEGRHFTQTEVMRLTKVIDEIGDQRDLPALLGVA